MKISQLFGVGRTRGGTRLNRGADIVRGLRRMESIFDWESRLRSSGVVFDRYRDDPEIVVHLGHVFALDHDRFDELRVTAPIAKRRPFFFFFFFFFFCDTSRRRGWKFCHARFFVQLEKPVLVQLHALVGHLKRLERHLHLLVFVFELHDDNRHEFFPVFRL